MEPHPKLEFNDSQIIEAIGDDWNRFLQDEHLSDVVARIHDESFYFDRSKGHLDGFLQHEGQWFLYVSGNLLNTLATLLAIAALKKYDCFDYFTAPMDGGASVGKTVREMVKQKIWDSGQKYDLSSSDKIDPQKISNTVMYYKNFQVSSYEGMEAESAVIGRDFYALIEYINARACVIRKAAFLRNGFFSYNSHDMFVGDDVNETSGTIKTISFLAQQRIPQMPRITYGVIVNKIDHKKKEFKYVDGFVDSCKNKQLDDFKDVGITPDINILTLHPYHGLQGTEKAWVILPNESYKVPMPVLYKVDPIKAMAREILRDSN